MSDWISTPVQANPVNDTDGQDWVNQSIPKPNAASGIPVRTASGLTIWIDPSKFNAFGQGLVSNFTQGAPQPSVYSGSQGLSVGINPVDAAAANTAAADTSAHPGYYTGGKVLGTALMGALSPEAAPDLLAGDVGAQIPLKIAAKQAASTIGKNIGTAELSLGGASAASSIAPGNPLAALAGGLLAPMSASALVNTAKAVPGAFSHALTGINQLRGKELSPSVLDPMVSSYLNAKATGPADITGVPMIPGFQPTPAAAANDLGLYPAQAALNSKGYGPLFQQRVGDNNAALTTALRALGPKLSNEQVSAAAANRVQALNAAAKSVVNDEYAPFDAIKSAVHVPADTVVAPVDAYLNGLNSSERDMIPQATLDKIFDWNGVVPINEIEGVRSSLGDAAQLAGSNGARVIRGVQRSLDQGLGNVQSIHNADGSFMAPVNGQAPLQMMQQGREANTWYRGKFPTQQPSNTPEQNFVAKVVSGKIQPSQVLNRAMQTPENLSALLKATTLSDGSPDPEIMGLAQNHYINNLFDASSNRAGGVAGGQLLNGYAMRDFRNGNGNFENMLFQPQQRGALDDLQSAAIMNNNIMRKALPGESGTNLLGNEQSGMNDALHQGIAAGLENLAPGAGFVSKMLEKLSASGKQAQQEQFRNRLAQALLDIPTYTKLRQMPATQENVQSMMEMLKRYPAQLKVNFMNTAALPGVQTAIAGASQ